MSLISLTWAILKAIFIKMLNMVLSKGILQIVEINDTFQNNVQTADTMNTMILVKNREGLKDLYEMISESHLNYFGERKPRIPKSMLKEKRENIMIASSANSIFRNDGELVRAYLRNFFSCSVPENLLLQGFLNRISPSLYSIIFLYKLA